MKPHLSNRGRRGLSLIELLVVAGLMSVISAATIVLYGSAQSSFEHASTKHSMNSFARNAVDRISTTLATATARRPGSPPEALYWPDAADSGITEHTYVDFLSTYPFIRQSPTECSYAFDNGGATPGYTPVFRYRLAWTGLPLGNIPGNSVYLERLDLAPSASTPMTGLYRQLVASHVNSVSFRRTLSGSIQCRVLVYSYDSVTGRGIDGQIMRGVNKRRRRDSTSTASREDAKSYEILTAIPLPTLNIR